MKKTIMTLTTAAALTLTAQAGGDIDPVTLQEVSTDAGFYTGLSLGASQTFLTSDWDYFSTDDNHNDVMYQLGFFSGYRYSINPDFFVDGQVGIDTTFAGNKDYDKTNIDFTVRPGYRVTKDIDLFAIVGASYTQFEGFGSKDTDWSPQIGFGGYYDITDSISAGVEYTYNTADFDDVEDLRNDKVLITAKYRF
jgi:opacity protein-like surface antigen